LRTEAGESFQKYPTLIPLLQIFLLLSQHVSHHGEFFHSIDLYYFNKAMELIGVPI
jgi:hypothetical protein